MSTESATGGTSKSPCSKTQRSSQNRGWKEWKPGSRKMGPSSEQDKKTTPDLTAAVVAYARPAQDQASEDFTMEVRGDSVLPVLRASGKGKVCFLEEHEPF